MVVSVESTTLKWRAFSETRVDDLFFSISIRIPMGGCVDLVDVSVVDVTVEKEVVEVVEVEEDVVSKLNKSDVIIDVIIDVVFFDGALLLLVDVGVGIVIILFMALDGRAAVMQIPKPWEL